MKHALRRTALGLVLVGAAGIGFTLGMPLRVLAPDMVQLAAARGVTFGPDARLVRGKAEARVAGSGLALRWRLAGLSVTPPGVRFTAEANGALGAEGSVIVAPFTRSLDLADLVLRGELAQLVRSPLATVEGEVEIDLHHASLALPDARIGSATGTVVWQNATLIIEEPIALGRVEARIAVPTPGKLTLDVTNSGGDLRLSGTVGLDQATGMAELDLLVVPDPDAPESLAALLDARGVAEGEGWRITQRFPLF